MHLFSILTFIFFTYLFHHARAISFYGVRILAQAPIVKFDITVMIPKTTTNPEMVNEIQAFWPGLQPEPEGVLYQQVITNQGGGPEEWYLLPFWCCNPFANLATPRKIYPGDILTTSFRWNEESQTWYDNWIITPGKLGHDAGETPYGGGLITDGHFDTEYAANNFNPMEMAEIMIELQRNGTWDWGSIVWSNIMIEAKTAETAWCTDDWNVWDGPDKKFQWTRTIPAVTYDANFNTTTCYVGEVVFQSHI